jgi:hypothetical protein
VVVATLHGSLQYEQTNQCIAAAARAARAAGSRSVLFDFRAADLANYYSYTVRHADVAPRLGLDTRFSLAFVGTTHAGEVLRFMEQVARSRGWRARAFHNMARALAWLRKQPATAHPA